MLVVEGDGDAAHHRCRIGELGLAVAGQVHADLMAERRQGSRQGANHICQAAGFGKWNAFRSYERDVYECGTSTERGTFPLRTL